jgi:hypothetical protein
MALEALLLMSQENISKTDPDFHSEDDPGSILRHLDGHLSDVPYDIRVCHNFRQIYDNFVMVRIVNNVSLLCLLCCRFKYTYFFRPLQRGSR